MVKKNPYRFQKTVIDINHTGDEVITLSGVLLLPTSTDALAATITRW